MKSDAEPYDSAGSIAPHRLSVRIVIMTIVACATMLAMYAARDGIAQKLFGRSYWTKTVFNARDIRLIQDAMHVQLPPNSQIELATFGGYRDHVLTIRMRTPRAELTALRKAIQGLAIEPTLAFLGTLQSSAPAWPEEIPNGEVFQVGDASQFILCNTDAESVIVYFEAYDWIDRNVGAVANEIFSQK